MTSVKINMIEPEILIIPEKIMLGMSLEMSLINNKTGELFRSFMPKRKEITTAKDAFTLDIRVYPQDYYHDFNPSKTFEKWAAVEVTSYGEIPSGMRSMVIPEGLYAKFHYKGISPNPSLFQWIFTQWVPHSGYRIDHRPHFDILGPQTKLNDPNSEEDICIPIIPI